VRDFDTERDKAFSKFNRKVKLINCSKMDEDLELSPDALEINSFMDSKEDIVYYYADVLSN
jgi:hypothetical protein